MARQVLGRAAAARRLHRSHVVGIGAGEVRRPFNTGAATSPVGGGDVAAALPSHDGPTALYYVRGVKPVLDVVLALVLLIVLLPLLLIISLALLSTTGRPIIFKQERVGRDGVTFTLWKFRTMVPDRRACPRSPYNGTERRRVHKSAHDPRVTSVGRLLRKWSFDELPQLWNVLRGDMSLVGPRPELVEIVSRYQEWQCRRHVVKPGITGLWQVSARGNGLMHEHVDLDLRYIEQMSLKTDFLILLRTISFVLGKIPGY